MEEELTGRLIKENRIKLGLTQEELANMIGVTRLSIIKYERDEPISKSKLVALKKIFQEQGDTITDTFGMKYEIMPCGRFKIHVPFVSATSFRNYINTNKTESTLCFLKRQTNDGSYVAFEIDNNSMDNNYRHSVSVGDIVLTRKINKDIFGDEYNNEDLWIIIINDSLMCKKIDMYDKVMNVIKCHSLNTSPEFSDFTLNLNSVHNIYKVIQRVTNM